MKLKDLILGALMSMTLCFVATSCSSDDDPNGGSSNGNSTIIVNNGQYSFSHGYYWKDTDGTMYIEFFSFDVNKYSKLGNSSFNYVSIDYPCSSDTPEPITLSASDYDIYFAVDQTFTDEGYQGETNNSNNSELVITKEGSTYHISATNAKGVGYGEEDEDYTNENYESITISIDLNGSLSPLPEEFRE